MKTATEGWFSNEIILLSCLSVREVFLQANFGGRRMNEKKNVPVFAVLTPDSHLALRLCLAKCSLTLSPPGHCCALCDCTVYVCVRVCARAEVLSNRWSNLILLSFLPCCPLALMVWWWCYLGLTSILSASFLESAHPIPPPLSALPCPALPRRLSPVNPGQPYSHTHTDTHTGVARAAF